MLNFNNWNSSNLNETDLGVMINSTLYDHLLLTIYLFINYLYRYKNVHSIN